MSAEQYFYCPFCPHTEWVSDEDPDASFGVMLGHIKWRHPEQDLSPGALWPKIAVSDSPSPSEEGRP